MTKSELKLFIRTLADDKVARYLVENTELDRFITEAEREAAERSLFFKTDGTYNIDVKSDIATYEVDDLIIFINRLKISGEPKPLAKTTRGELDFEIYDWESKTDTPKMYLQENNILTLYPIPNADKTLLVDAYRRPEQDMETPAHLHESLVYWVFHRIYSIPDADVYNPNKSVENLQIFSKVFGHKRSINFDRAWRNGASHSPLYRHEFSG